MISTGVPDPLEKPGSELLRGVGWTAALDST